MVPIISFSCNSCKDTTPNFTYSANAQPFIESYNNNLWQNRNTLEWPWSLCFSETLKLNYRPVLPNHGICCTVKHKLIFQLVHGLAQEIDGLQPASFSEAVLMPSSDSEATQKNIYEILIQMTYCWLFVVVSVPRPPPWHLVQSRVINYQSMGITLLLTAHLEFSWETWGRKQSS